MARFFPIVLLAAAACGCSAEWYHRSADDEVYAIVAHEQKSVRGVAQDPFKVEQRSLSVLDAGQQGEREDLEKTPAPKPVQAAVAIPQDATNPAQAAPSPSQGAPVPSQGARAPGQDGATPAQGAPPAAALDAQAPDAQAPAPPAVDAVPALKAPIVPTRVLDLRSAMRLAFANNRDYQTQKESLYLAALSLTLAQHQFAPRFFGILTGEWTHDSTGAESGSLAPSFGWSMLLVNGARLSITLAQSFFQFFTGERREVAQTVVSGTLTQPLLRGFGTEIVREPLTQAERDVTYEVRSFERFRETFAVSVISEYYLVLEARDRVTNAYLNWQSLVSSRDRIEALTNAQRRPRFELGQARTDELRAQDDWVSAVERYESALDRFKITLGIPADEDITLLQTELDQLSKQPVESLRVTVDVAVASALFLRLDLKTARDEVADTERQVRVAEDGLRTQLDIAGSAGLATNSNGAQKPFKLNGGHGEYSVGFTLDLPFDRKAERNAYVAAIINHQRRRRDLSLSEDNVRLTIRDSYRRLDREVASFNIQKQSLALAEERVESMSLLLQAGLAETRDVLDAQSALNSARNAVTSALINFAIARLEFLKDAEALRVTDDGLVTALPVGARSDGGA
jgi:outer membrane protein TolC